MSRQPHYPLHLVTCVERPALRESYQDLRKVTADAIPTDAKRLRDRLNDLAIDNEQQARSNFGTCFNLNLIPQINRRVSGLT